MTPWEVASPEEAEEFVKSLSPAEQRRVLDACLSVMEDTAIQAALQAFDLVDA